MAYWLVYQGDSFRRSRDGGYLWAPQANEKGETHFTWANMSRLRQGDLVFSGMGAAIRALSYVEREAYPAEGPDPRDAKTWYGIGWRADVSYVDIPVELRYREWVPAIREFLPAKYGPFDKNNDGNQGYLFELPIPVGEYLLERCKAAGVDSAFQAATAVAPPIAKATQREAIVMARLGQGKFRDDLMKRWNGRCAVTGLARAELLRASHAKPWSACNDVERLDPSNGLMLSAMYDAAFDARLISFSDDGSVVLAPDFTADAAKSAGISPAAEIKLADEKLRLYLATHRALMFSRVVGMT